MSTFGLYRIQLRRERQERLRRAQERERLARVRQETRRALTCLQSLLGRCRPGLEQHFGSEAQREGTALAKKARRQLKNHPDEALALARRAVAAAERGLKQASTRAEAWTRQKTEAHEAVSVLVMALETASREGCLAEADDSHMAEAAGHLDRAATALRREDFKGALQAARSGQAATRQAEQARQERQERETLRREVVRSLRQVLGSMQFTVLPPRRRPADEGGAVVLSGRLPSGHTARFEIALDGQVAYDFDGYHGQACGKDEEAIRRALETTCQAEATDHCRRWKTGPAPKIGSAGRRQRPEPGHQRHW